MGRPVKFSEKSILDATLELVAATGVGSATVTGVAEALGAPSGSIYHRFPSRDILVARLWIRTVTCFQHGFLGALDLADPIEAARSAILHTPRWASEHQAAAALLLRYSRDDLMRTWPDELGNELRALNAPVREALLDFARKTYGCTAPEVIRGIHFALIDIPYSAARSHIRSGRPLNGFEEELLVSAGEAVLADLHSREG